MIVIVHATPGSYELSFSGVDAAGYGTFMWAQVNAPAKLTEALANAEAVCMFKWFVVTAFEECCCLLGATAGESQNSVRRRSRMAGDPVGTEQRVHPRERGACKWGEGNVAKFCLKHIPCPVLAQLLQIP